MTGNGIGDEGAKVLSKGLKRNTSLTTLNLRCEDERREREDGERRIV